jgi:hypothetical protein
MRRVSRPDPIQESHHGRDDVLDEFRIPVGDFDSEFRMPWFGRRNDYMECLRLLALMSVVVIPAVLFTQYVAAAVARSGYALAATYLTAIILAGRHALGMRGQPRDMLAVNHLITTKILGPLFVLMAVGLAAWTTTVVGSIVYFGTIAVPAMAIVADNLMTHAVYWMTANPQVDLATMLSVRDAWRYRFAWLFGLGPTRETLLHLSPELENTFRWYPLQPVLLATMVSAPQLAWLWPARQESEMLGTRLVAGCLVSGLLAFVVLRWPRGSQSRRSWTAQLVHWLRYEPEALAPPWVFRSPVGQPGSRLAVFALGFPPVAAAVLGMTTWCSFIPAPADFDTVRSLADGATLSWWQALGSVLRGLACLTLTIGCYVVAVFGLSHNLIRTLHRLFEE